MFDYLNVYCIYSILFKSVTNVGQFSIQKTKYIVFYVKDHKIKWGVSSK